MSQLGQSTNMWIFSTRIDRLKTDYCITLSTLVLSLIKKLFFLFCVSNLSHNGDRVEHPRKIVPKERTTCMYVIHQLSPDAGPLVQLSHTPIHAILLRNLHIYQP